MNSNCHRLCCAFNHRDSRLFRWAALAVALAGITLAAALSLPTGARLSRGRFAAAAATFLTAPPPTGAFTARASVAGASACAPRGAGAPPMPAFFLPLGRRPAPVDVAGLRSVGEVARAAVAALALPEKLGRAVTAADVSVYVIERKVADRIAGEVSDRIAKLVAESEKGEALGPLDNFDAGKVCEESSLFLELEDQIFFAGDNAPAFPKVHAIQNEDWSDYLLYTPIGQAHDAWRLLPKAHIAPLTAEAQQLIYSRQFPASGCTNARFLVSNGNGNRGLGSILHVTTAHLSFALEQGRIFLWREGVGAIYADEETCGKGMVSLECFFRAASSCNIHHARLPGADTKELEGTGEHDGLSDSHVPSVMKELWDKEIPSIPAIVPRAMELKYWWRAQAVAFLARFNDNTIDAIRLLRKNNTELVVNFGAGDPPPHTASSKIGFGWPPAQRSSGKEWTAEFPFQRGMTSMHVRHGDKADEMKLIPNEAYFAAAESLVMQNPMGLVRAAFISTEDPGTLAAAANEQRGWANMWYNVPRINSNGADQLNAFSLPRAVLTRIWFLQLLMALECDAWVGTRGSNWNRLIDELRCIWVPKCKQPYVDIGSKVEGNEWSPPFDYFGW